MNYIGNVVDPTKTPQSEPLPGSNQVPNSAGGFAFAVSHWTRLERFLILGSEGGSYYASERDLTKENVNGLKAALAEDGMRFVNTVAEISHAGRAPKNDPALFALALAASDKRLDVSRHALSRLRDVARIPTHLFHFAGFIDALKMRGWGRSLKAAVADWYLDQDDKKLANQVMKYQSRDGWSNQDLLRLSHAHPRTPEQTQILRWVAKGWESIESDKMMTPAMMPIWAFEQAKGEKDESKMVKLITDHELPRECVPTELLKSVKVWDALLQKMPMTAMIRNLGKMTSIGLIAPNSDAARLVGTRLGDREALRKARVHPLTVLMAQAVYKSNRGMKGSLTWEAVPVVSNALEKAFYDAFAFAPKTGKRFYIGLDVSGSMTSGSVAGTPLTPREAGAAMCMVTMRTEPEYYVAGFTNGSYQSLHSASGFNSGVTKLELNPVMSLTEVVRYTSNLSFGGTDCSLPMRDALAKKIPVDVFLVITDSETWAGAIHPTIALQQYRNKMGIDAKLVVMGMVSNGFSIADPTDAGMLDIVGFDANCPMIISDFASGGAVPAAVDADDQG